MTAGEKLFVVHVRYLQEGVRRSGNGDKLSPWFACGVFRDRELAGHAADGIAQYSYNARTRVRRVKPDADPWSTP